MTATIQAPKLTQIGARAVLDAALACADALGVPQVVAVLDEGGHLLAFARMDGAPLPSVQAAQDKAYSALIGLPTDQLSSAVSANPGLHEAMAGMDRITSIGGGTVPWPYLVFCRTESGVIADNVVALANSWGAAPFVRSLDHA
ncbi:MAG: heme-binding protein [Pseudomonadota bacterium]